MPNGLYLTVGVTPTVWCGKIVLRGRLDVAAGLCCCACEERDEDYERREAAHGSKVELAQVRSPTALDPRRTHGGQKRRADIFFSFYQAGSLVARRARAARAGLLRCG